ncbi:hypothetical protein ARMGADRAFT_692518 [Armillaria gallica]|uniref:Uncharacterized protein n=1 Tax=Armillaria gallica TaxID=47427 RepID=A0A2H3E6Z7_ARMGA|nr:hypothetical protein ARMGADRAFT_692518 [Armillaria gallica]
MNSQDGQNFRRLGKCWSRLVEIDEFARPKHRSDSSPTSASGPVQGLPASPKTRRRILKVMDGSVAFDRLRLTHIPLSRRSFLCYSHLVMRWVPDGSSKLVLGGQTSVLCTHEKSIQF